jgi:hypothetical protein
MTGGGKQEITFSRCSCTRLESELGEDMLCPKLDTDRKAIIDANNNFDGVIIEDTSEWLERASKWYRIQRIVHLAGTG